MYYALVDKPDFASKGSGWRTVRELRNQLIGHPADPKRRRFSYLTRITLSDNNVDAIVVDHSKGKNVSRTFDPREAIADYAHDASDALEALLTDVRHTFAPLFTADLNPEVLSAYDENPPERVEYVFKIVEANGAERRLH